MHAYYHLAVPQNLSYRNISPAQGQACQETESARGVKLWKPVGIKYGIIPLDQHKNHG
jgi:hypothetical protein